MKTILAFTGALLMGFMLTLFVEKDNAKFFFIKDKGIKKVVFQTVDSSGNSQSDTGIWFTDRLPGAYIDSGRLVGNVAPSAWVIKEPDSLGAVITALSGRVDALSSTVSSLMGGGLTLSPGAGISISGSYPSFTIGLTTPTINTTARSVNTNFTPSMTRYTLGIYSITCGVTNPLLAGSSSITAYLEYSNNNGVSWAPASPPQVGNSSSVALTVTIQITNGQTGILMGIIPPGYLCRIRTSGSGTYSTSIPSSFEFNFY